ncbi:hypothetical protein [Cyclobacterium sp.]|uniref:hypothetical protein n=1 Tax=Cyclobacterium sp. TaxID=1966343 RepID=UPI00198B8108|nr:hypothetical protein [Cyclobacterium sp.]MBD3626795.1 hypothetical protein [Cyclobacterium sp.]
MTKHHLHVSLFITLLFIVVQACTDSGEDFDHAGLYGSWKMVDFHEHHQLN